MHAFCRWCGGAFDNNMGKCSVCSRDDDGDFVGGRVIKGDKITGNTINIGGFLPPDPRRVGRMAGDSVRDKVEIHIHHHSAPPPPAPSPEPQSDKIPATKISESARVSAATRSDLSAEKRVRIQWLLDRLDRELVRDRFGDSSRIETDLRSLAVTDKASCVLVLEAMRGSAVKLFVALATRLSEDIY